MRRIPILAHYLNLHIGVNVYSSWCPFAYQPKMQNLNTEYFVAYFDLIGAVGD